MTTLKQLLAVAIGLFVAFQAPQSVAAPVTIHAGQTAIFNFDYTGNTPPPPYAWSWTEWRIYSVFDDVETDSGTIRTFSGLNASGGMLSDLVWNDAFYHVGGGDDLGFNDGVFSIVFASITGSATIGSFNSYFMTVAGESLAYEGNPEVVIFGGNDVPEPASLFLLGSGLLALTAMRRKSGKSI